MFSNSLFSCLSKASKTPSSAVYPTRAHFSVVPYRSSAARFLSNQSSPSSTSSPNGASEGKHTKSRDGASSQEPIHGTETDANEYGNDGGKEAKTRSPHAQWYSEFVPGMIPIALLGSAVYIGLQLVQTKLATEKYLDEANARIAQLEGEIKRLQSEQEIRDRGRASSGSPSSKLQTDSKRSSSRWWWFS